MKNAISTSRRIVWSRNMVLDVDLFAKTETEILQHLSKRGYKIFFMTGHSEGKSDFKDSNINVFSIPVGKSNFPLKYHMIFAMVQLFTFPFYILKVKPDFIIVDWDSIFSLMPMVPFCGLLGAKVILDIRSTPTPIQNLHQKVGLRLYLLNLGFKVSVLFAKKKLDGITIITELMKKEVCSEFGIDPKCVGVWSSGVSSELFRSESVAQNGVELRKKLGLAGKFIVFYHGGFSQSRGIIDAIDAMAIVRSRYPDAVLFLLGKGSVQTIGEIESAIQKGGLQGQVFVHDAVDYVEVPRYIAMCDVGIVPLPDLAQWRNQCPLKLLEYLSMEKTTILSDIPCHREVVGNRKCGIFLSSVSPNGIAASIVFALDNRDRIGEWGAEGRKIVKNKYTWDRVAENLDEYLKSL